MPKLNLYVINSKAAAGRLQHITQIKELLKGAFVDGIDLILVSDHEADGINQETIQTNTDFSQLPADAPSAQAFNSLIVPIHVRHVSNFLNHRAALRRIAEKGSTAELHVVIEDDVVFGDRVGEALGEALAAFTAAPGKNLLFLGMPSAQGEGDAGPIGDFKRYYNVTPVCDSYAVTPTGAAALAAAMAKMKFSTNIQLSYAVHAIQEIDAGFSRPNVFIDGSKLGVFVSSIEVNNSLVLSAEHQQLKAFLEGDDAQGARAFHEGMRFKNHVDNVRILADIEHKAGNHDRSKALYEECFKTLSTNGCSVLNNQSQFLRNYISACKDFSLVR